MEATGVYHEHLAWWFHDLGYAIHIVLPYRAHRYMQSIGIKSKNDKIDAQGLAAMGMQQELDVWKPCSKNVLLLRSLTRQYEMLQATKTNIANQLEAAATHLAHCDKMVISNFNSLIKTVSKETERLKKRIEGMVLSDPFLAKKYELVKPVKGLGILSFATLVAETGSFQLFENQKQLVSYSGYDVVENQSGKRVGKTKISKKGNGHIRRVLFMPAFNVVRYNTGNFHQLYERVYERTKVKMKAYVAVQRKLLCLIYTLWKKDAPFDNEYIKQVSGNYEPKPLFSVGSAEPEKEVAKTLDLATQDELPCNQSPEALFSVV